MLSAHAMVVTKFGSQQVEGQAYVTVRTGSGDLIRTEPDVAISARILHASGGARIVLEGGIQPSRPDTITLVQPGSGRLEFEYVPGAGGTPPAGTRFGYRRYRLKHIFPDRYAVPSSAANVATAVGEPLCTLTYPVTTPWQVSQVDCFGGSRLVLLWANGVVTSIALWQPGATAGREVVRYQYAQGRLSNVRWPVTREEASYAYRWPDDPTLTAFAVRRGSYVPVSDQAVGLRVVTQKRIDNFPVLKHIGPQGNDSYPPGVRREWTENAQVGYIAQPGRFVSETHVRTQGSRTAWGGEAVEETYETENRSGLVTGVELACHQPSGGNCTTVTNASKSWVVSAGLPEPINRSYKDYRGGFTVWDAGVSCWPASACTSGPALRGPDALQATEVRGVCSGADDATGRNALSTVEFSWQYASDGRGTHEKLPAQEVRASVLAPNATTTRSWRFDPNTKRLEAEFQTGWTRTVRAGPGQLVQRTIGTFYFDRYACEGSSSRDPFGRTLEVHGPCFVGSATAVDCDASLNDTIPITQYEYSPVSASAGNKSGRLARTSTFANTTTTSCTGARRLDTWFDEYDDFGNVVQERDANGWGISRSFEGTRLKAETKAGQTTLYFYDDEQGGKLYAKRNPSGLWEVFCYQIGADNGCRNGTVSGNLQWSARLTHSGFGEPARPWPIADKTVFTYSAPGAQPGGGLLTRQDSWRAGAGAPDVRQGFGYDPLGRKSSSFSVGDTGTAHTSFESLFDENGNLLASGVPSNASPQACGGQAQAPGEAYRTSASQACSRFRYDRLDRLDRVQTFTAPGQSNPGELDTHFSYDAHGNVRSVTRAPGGTIVTYDHDDFGNVVRIAGQWMSGQTDQEFDARGNVVRRKTPELGSLATWLEYAYDAMNRPLSARPAAFGRRTAFLWRYGYDDEVTAPPANCPLPTDALTRGRVQWKQDSFGRTWYEYNALGQVRKLRRTRGDGTGACSTMATRSSDATPDTEYTYHADGRLWVVKYPHGRFIRYDWGGAGAQDRVTAVSHHPGGAGPWRVLVENIRYSSTGAIEGWDLGTTSPTSVEYLRGASAALGGRTASCTTARPTSSDGSTRLWGLFVNAAPLSAAASQRTGDVFRRTFEWKGEQIAAQATCLRGEANPVREFFTYDGVQQVTAASRPLRDFTVRGGPYGKRTFDYALGGDRLYATEDCTGWQSVYAPSGTLTEVHPRGNACAGVCTADSSWASRAMQYDDDGRLVELRDTPWPRSRRNAARRLTLTPDDGFGAVYREVNVNGGAYQYFYDAQGRRRLKLYPNGLSDEFFYDGDALIEDRGVTTHWPTAQTTERYMLNEYVWLAGRPVAVLKRVLDSTFTDVAAPAGCMRNDEVEGCGVRFIVTDELPKPVLLLDEAGRIAGTGDYDVFGRVNHVPLVDDSPAPPNPPGSTYPFGGYFANQDTILSYVRQPARSATQRVEVKVKYGSINTSAGGGDVTWVEDGQGRALTPTYSGRRLGQVDTPWLAVPADGLMHVRWRSDGQQENDNYTGVTVAAYEYRRYEAGATPWWVPLRFPGQYADVESGLFENWNRFYDPAVGRYTASDPVLGLAAAVAPDVFRYAGNNPLAASDPAGLLPPDGFSTDRVAGATVLLDKCLEAEDGACEAIAAQNDAMVEGLLTEIMIIAPGLGPVGAAVLVALDPSETASDDTRVAAAGITYQTYEKVNPKTGEVYAGKTSGTGSPEENVAARDVGHHKNKEGFGPAKLDKSSTNPDAIRGREQLRIEANGGAKSMGGSSGNAINGISPKNPKRLDYIRAALRAFRRTKGR